jgi:hypothetical protein
MAKQLFSLNDARGMVDERPIGGARRGTMDILTEWTEWADKVLVF